MLIQEKKREILLVPIQISGGTIGGIAQYYSVSRDAIPNGSITVYGFLGGVAGAIAVTLIAARLKQDLSLRHNFVGAIATGFAFDLVLKGIVSILTLQSQVQRLETANISAQYEHINTLSEVAQVQNPAQRKQKIINRISDIASTTSDRTIKEKAISAVDETAEISSQEIKLNTIKDLKELALNTDDPEIKEQILIDLTEYTQGYSQVVMDAAKSALATITR